MELYCYNNTRFDGIPCAAMNTAMNMNMNSKLQIVISIDFCASNLHESGPERPDQTEVACASQCA